VLIFMFVLSWKKKLPHLISQYVSAWCGREFEFYWQPFLLTCRWADLFFCFKPTVLVRRFPIYWFFILYWLIWYLFPTKNALL